MLNKKYKKRGFTLIELIIVIAIIAILAAIAVPAFGKIRTKANVSADLGNARTIYSLVATELASDNIQYGTGIQNVSLECVGNVTCTTANSNPIGSVNIKAQIDPAPTVKTYQGANFVVTITADGSIQVNVKLSDNSIKQVYPTATGKYLDPSSN